MRDDLKQILDSFHNVCAEVKDRNVLQELREKYLSRERGLVPNLLKRLKEIPADERPSFGKEVNILKETVEKMMQKLEDQVRHDELRRQVEAERVDVTMPAAPLPRGTFHPVKEVERRICDIFRKLGYEVAEGPEVETDFHNFGALNFPPDHPARDAQDTFFVSSGKYLLRTHTSPVQVRTMQSVAPPLKLIAPGKVYRMDMPDATHSPVFHQIEGLVVGEGVSMADLKGTLTHFARELFSEETRIRLRPSFFPFVEPGAEVDISCIFCGGDGCRVCKGSGWIEILGAGMVHPNVFSNCGIDSERYTGFAFGMGVDRIAILRYGVPDIRMFWENDVRFLNQFAKL